MPAHHPAATDAPGIESTRWRIDPLRSDVAFEVKTRWGMATVRGAFSRYHGTLDLGHEPAVVLTVVADTPARCACHCVSKARSGASGAVLVGALVRGVRVDPDRTAGPAEALAA